MNKVLRIPLLLVAMLLTNLCGYAQKDEASYAVTNGIFCENLWELSRKNGHFTNHYLADNYTFIRGATIWGKPEQEKILFSWSKPYSYESDELDYTGTPIIKTDYRATLIMMDLYTGEIEKEIQLSYKGVPITGLLCANDIGVDDAGNVWISSAALNTETKPLTIHVVTDVENGICGTRWELTLPLAETNNYGRIDYCDIAGDVTGKTMDAVCMAPLSAATNLVYRWRLCQGDDYWYGDFDGYICWDLSSTILETYPADVIAWSTSDCTIVSDPDGVWPYFYVDGQNTCPSLYNINRKYVDGFSNAPELAPKVMIASEIPEFSIGNKNFIAYGKNLYSSDPGCQIGIAEVGVGFEFDGMKEYWLLPANGLGTISDGGMRIHKISTVNVTDANGKNGVYLMTYKANNGVAVYLIAEEGFDGKNVNKPITATSITLDKTELKLNEGATTQLVATILPENTANKTVSWSSNNVSVAKVDASGLVTAISAGDAIITATTTDGNNLSASCSISVSKPTADYAFAIQNIELFANSSVVLPVEMINVGEITAFQADIYLPEDVKIATDSHSRFNVTLSDRASDTHTISTQTQSDGAVRIMAYSNYNDPFEGNSGVLFNVPLEVGNIEGNFTIYIKNISLSDAQANEIKLADAIMELNVNKFRKGDANGDSRISITDLTATARYILGITPANFIFSAADINEDERIAINDLVAIANLVMTEDISTSSKQLNSQSLAVKNTVNSDMVISIDDFSISAGEEKTISVNLANSSAVVGFQCDIILPDGLEFVTNKAGRVSATIDSERCWDHTFMSNMLDTLGTSCRMVCYSNYNTEIDGNDGSIFTFKVKAKEDAKDGEGQINIINAELSDADAQSIFPVCKPANVEISGNSSINEMLINDKIIEIGRYDLYGRKLSKPSKGINIIQMSDGSTRKEFVK